MKMTAACSSTGPMNVLNIRLNCRGAVSVPLLPQTGHCASGCPGVPLIFDRAHERLEHQIELTRRAERALAAADGTLCVRLPRRPLDLRIVGAEAVLALLAVDQGIREAGDVTGRFPDLRVHQDRGIEP